MEVNPLKVRFMYHKNYFLETYMRKRAADMHQIRAMILIEWKISYIIVTIGCAAGIRAKGERA